MGVKKIKNRDPNTEKCHIDKNFQKSSKKNLRSWLILCLKIFIIFKYLFILNMAYFQIFISEKVFFLIFRHKNQFVGNMA
jgi:hypothetical protein